MSVDSIMEEKKRVDINENFIIVKLLALGYVLLWMHAQSSSCYKWEDIEALKGGFISQTSINLYVNKLAP